MDGRREGGVESGDASGPEPDTLSADDATDFDDVARTALEELDHRRPSRCPSCGGTALQRWGKGRSKVQRWRCRCCERSFSTTTGTLLAGLHAPGKLRLVLLDMLSGEPASCRGLATNLAVSAMTIWAWRRRADRRFTEAVATPTLRERFESFLRPFCGPARQHLLGYVAWFAEWQAATLRRPTPAWRRARGGR
jgi:transposase-like protein